MIMGKAVVSSVLLSESASKLLKRSVIFVVIVTWRRFIIKTLRNLTYYYLCFGIVLALFSFFFLLTFCSVSSIALDRTTKSLPTTLVNTFIYLLQFTSNLITRWPQFEFAWKVNTRKKRKILIFMMY